MITKNETAASPAQAGAETAPVSGKHTPGPWETGSLMTRVEVLPQGWNMPLCIADCHAGHAPESEAERVANARLLAAAPDMLEALKSVLASVPFASYRGDGELEECEQMVRSAIARAERGGA